MGRFYQIQRGSGGEQSGAKEIGQVSVHRLKYVYIIPSHLGQNPEILPNVELYEML